MNEETSYMQDSLESIILKKIDLIKKENSERTTHQWEFLDTRSGETHIVTLKVFSGYNYKDENPN